MAEASSGDITSLYIHVPFCARKCDYCAFYSQVGDAAQMDRYVTALGIEMERVAAELRPGTIFFGGGTPSLLTPRHWERVFGFMDRLGLLGAAEWTIECNPATVSLDKARLWKSAGVNRVSMGMQSLDAALLERLGRIHTREGAFRSYDLLRRAGFDNLNLDMMFAIPSQSREAWQSTLNEALAMDSEHLSSYEVIYEEDTPLFEQLAAGRVEVDEDLASDMYEDLVRHATARGFRQYEVANFAREGTGERGETPARACRHNVNYWRGGSFHGLGPSATSYVRGVRTRNCANTTLYCERIEQGHAAEDFRESLSPLGRAGETAAFGLRLTAGWPFAVFKEVTGFDLRAQWAEEMRRLVNCGWAAQDEERFRLTPQGLRFADAAAQEFLQVGEP
jgi:oxygen-independent coproporphyrinogen III oxidase